MENGLIGYSGFVGSNLWRRSTFERLYNSHNIRDGDKTSIVDAASNSPYDRHRYDLEQWARANFPNCRIIHLPALFGPSLKKNALLDLIHDNKIAAFYSAGLFQWDPVRRLWWGSRGGRVSVLSICSRNRCR
ncbi:MAG TPA: hypothetical protein VIJ35_11380 [Bradyrhizobium sp.]